MLLRCHSKKTETDNKDSKKAGKADEVKKEDSKAKEAAAE